MDAAVDLDRDDQAPPESGVRRRVVALALAPRPTPGRDVLVEVTEQVFFEVWGVVRALSPLQGAWLKLGLGQIGAAVLTISTWHCEPGARPSRILRERWPELVPGQASLDVLAHLMVDALCG